MWVWLDPHRSVIGGHMYLEAHCEPPGTSRETKLSRSARRPHAFSVVQADGLEVYTDFGQLTKPEELHLERRGWINRRIEAFWNGCIFVVDETLGPDPMPDPR